MAAIYSSLAARGKYDWTPRLSNLSTGVFIGAPNGSEAIPYKVSARFLWQQDASPAGTHVASVCQLSQQLENSADLPARHQGIEAENLSNLQTLPRFGN